MSRIIGCAAALGVAAYVSLASSAGAAPACHRTAAGDAILVQELPGVAPSAANITAAPVKTPSVGAPAYGMCVRNPSLDISAVIESAAACGHARVTDLHAAPATHGLPPAAHC